MMGHRHFGAVLIALGVAGCAQAPTTLSSLTTGSILPAIPSPTSLLPTTSANGTPRPPERVSGNLYRIFATDRKLDNPEQAANYVLLRAAESTRQMGGTHFIIVDTHEGTIPKSAGPAKLAPSGGLIRIFRADSDIAPPTGAIAVDEIINFFGPTFGREAQPAASAG